MRASCDVPWVGSMTCSFLLNLVKPAQSSVIWRPLMAFEVGDDWSTWHFSLLFGALLGLCFMVAFICVLIPILIITWTTVLVIWFLFGKGLRKPHSFVMDGHQMAMEMCQNAVVNVLREGRVVVVIASSLCFFALKTL